MKFSLMVQDNVLILKLFGRFHHRMATKLLKLFNQGHMHSFSKVSFDVTHVSSIDRSGLGTLFLFAHRLKKLGGETFVVNPQTFVRDQMIKADLPSMLHIVTKDSESRSAA